MNLIKKLLIGLAIGVVVFAGVNFGIEVFQAPGSTAKADSVELTCNNRTVGNTATYNPFTPLETTKPNPVQNANGSCADIPLLTHFNPVLGSLIPNRDLTLDSGGSTAIQLYYNNGANPVGGAAITNPTANLDISRVGNRYTIKGALKGTNANLSSSESRAGGDLTINVPAGMKLAYRGETTRWFPQAIIRKELQATTGNTPDDQISDNSTNGVDSNPIFSSFAGYTIPASTGINLSYADTNKDAVRDANSPNQLNPGFLNYGYVLLNLYVTADNLPPILPNQVITIPQGGSGDFKSYITDQTLKGTDPGNNIPLSFTTGSLTGLNGVNCTNNATTGVITCAADINAPLSPDRTFTVTPKNSINITGPAATYTVKIIAPQAPNLGLTKSANPASEISVNLGDTITYTLNYTNTGNTAATNVVITDILDSKITYREGSCTPAAACVYNATTKTLTWTIASLAAGATGSGTFVATVNSGATGTISNKASISATGVTPFDSNTVIHPIAAPQAPNLGLTKSANPASGLSVTAGQVVTYTLNFTNTGRTAATNVVITDILDSKITYREGSCTPAAACVYNATTKTLTWTIASLAAGATGSGTFVATVNSGATGTISNKASISATGVTPFDSNTVNHPILIPLPPVLPNQVITITQGGSGDFKSYITDPIFKGTDPGNNIPLSFTTGTLTGLNGVTCTNNATTGVITCTADANAPLSPDRTFTVTPKNSINITGTAATYTIKIVAPDKPILNLSKSSSPASGSNVTAGQVVTYTLNFTNTGRTAATNVVITDVLDTKITYKEGSCEPAAACAYNSATRTLTWTIPSLAAGATGTGTFVATVNSGATGTITNKATISATGVTPVDSNIVTLVVINPLTLLKSTDKTTVQSGQTINYTLQYRNAGASELTDVVITDVLDSKTTFITNSCGFNPQNTGYNCVYTDSNKTLTVNFGTLAAGATGNVTFQVSVNSGASGTVVNQATITSKETGLVRSNQIIISIQGIITTLPVLNITKTASSSIVNPNSTVTYTINYSNTGSANATGVKITDVLDSKLTYVEGTCLPAANCVYDKASKTLTYSIATLNAGASGNFSFQATVSGDATGSISNTGSIKSDQNPNPVISTVIITVPTINNGLSIAKSASNSTINAGATVTYSINYTNNTGREATNVIISDVLDGKLTYVDGSCSPSNVCRYNDATKTITWTIANLADKATGIGSFQAKINGDATGTVPNTVSIRSDQNPNPITSTVTINVNTNIKAILTVSPKIIYINKGPVDLRITNILDGNNKPIANASCRIDLVMSDGSTASVVTTSDANGVCAATIGQSGGIFSTAGFPGASGSGSVNKLTSVLGVVKATGTVTTATQTTTTNLDQYTVIALPTKGDTPRTGGFEIFTAATSGIVAMLGYLYYTNFTNKQGAKFSPKRTKEGTQN